MYFHHGWIITNAWSQSGLTFSNVTHFQLFSDPSIFQKKKEGKKKTTSQVLIKSYIHLTMDLRDLVHQLSFASLWKLI